MTVDTLGFGITAKTLMPFLTAVRTFCLVITIVLPVTKPLAFLAAQRCQDKGGDCCDEEANFQFFRVSRRVECQNQGVCWKKIALCPVHHPTYISDTLICQFALYVFIGHAREFPYPDNPFGGVKGFMRRRSHGDVYQTLAL